MKPANLLLWLLCLCACCLFGSCNTTIGLGRDMRILGESMERSGSRGQGADVSGAPIY